MLTPETFEQFDRSFEAMLLDLLTNCTPAPHMGEGQLEIALDLETLAGHLARTVVTMGNCMRQIAASL